MGAAGRLLSTVEIAEIWDLLLLLLRKEPCVTGLVGRGRVHVENYEEV